MASKITLKNLQDQEFSINHNDNAGAISINSNDIAKVSTIETSVAPFNKGMKNFIINGSFDIWQRGLNFASYNGYTADRWVGYATGTLPTFSKQTGYITGTYCLNAAGVAGNTDIAFYQRIESNNAKAFSTNSGVLSFWFYSNIQRTAYITITTPNSVDNFASVTTVLQNSFTFLVGWNKYTLSIPANSAYINGMSVVFCGYGFPLTSGNIALSNVQLEEGSVATPFEQRPYGLELSLCQRYYEVNNTNNYGSLVSVDGQYRTWNIPFTVTKRVVPTMTFSGGNITPNPSTSINGFTYTVPGLTSTTFYYFTSYTASAEL